MRESVTYPPARTVVGRVADRFVPESARTGDRHELRRLRLVARGCLAFIALPVLPTTVMIASGRPELLFIPFGVVFCGLLCLKLLSSGRSSTTIATLLVGAALCLLATGATYQGGINAPMTPVMLHLAPIGFMLSGRTLGLVMAVAVVVVFIALGLYSDDPLRLLRTGVLIAAHLMLVWLVAGLDALHVAANEAVSAANEELAQANEELASARVTAEHALHARSRVLAVVSHEVRNPMNGIMGVSQLMRGSATSAEQREYADLLYTSSEAVLAIVNSLLDHSKLETGKVELERIPFAIPTVIEKALSLYRHRAQEKGLELTMVAHESLISAYYGDPTRLLQILINLLGNAIKFTARGSVRVQVDPVRSDSSSAEWVRFEVRDTGIGIAEEQRAAIFAEYTQASTSTAREYGGTGLGLTICKELVELMGGEIGVTSELDAGSAFWFAIPLTPAPALLSGGPSVPAATLSQADADTQASWPSGKKLLVVEDNLINQRVTLAMLRELGHEADVVNNGADALAALAKRPYDLVLMDCHMPVMDGFTATRAIRAREGDRPRMPIIALTGAATDQDRQACLDAGMDECLVKPIARDALKAVLKAWSD